MQSAINIVYFMAVNIFLGSRNEFFFLKIFGTKVEPKMSMVVILPEKSLEEKPGDCGRGGETAGRKN